jgi:Putative transposase of IS4/5 family (DUF4096)
MWTPETRARHKRDHLRYGSDLSDEEWQLIAPFMPPPAKTGRRRVWPMREMLNAILYILSVVGGSSRSSACARVIQAGMQATNPSSCGMTIISVPR